MNPKFERLALIARLLLAGFRKSRESAGRYYKYRKTAEDDEMFVVETRSDWERYNCAKYTPDIDPEYPDDWDGVYMIVGSAEKTPDKFGPHGGSTKSQVLAFLKAERAI